MKALFRSVTLILALLPLCATADDYSAFDHSSRLMLYFRINLGGQNGQIDAARFAPQFGLRLDRDLPFRYALDNDPTRWQVLGMRQSISMLDLQFAARSDSQVSETLRLGGAAMMSSDGSEKTVWQNPWLWVGVGVGILAISCASDNWPCDSGSGNGMGGGGGY
jgi:hypothetical protein